MAELSVCVLSTFYPPASFGGDAVLVQRFARGAARRGLRVRVLYNPTAFDMLAQRRVESSDPADEDIEVVPVPAGRLATTGTFLTGRPTGYRRQLERLTAGFDILHFNNPSLLGGPGAFGMGDGLRLYVTQEHWLVCPTHVLFRYRREPCTRRTCIRCQLSYHRPPQAWRLTSLMQDAVARLDALLCPSRFTANRHREHFPDARIELLRFPVPELEPEPGTGPEGEPPPRPYFLFAGRLERIKGAEELIRAFASVRGADLVVAGDGDERPLIEKLAASNPAVRVLGLVPHERVVALARQALAVVVPSIGYETFGGVAVEGMAVGTPAVVRDIGPLPELVEDGGGFVFSDDHDLGTVLQRLVDDPGAAMAAGDRAREVAASRFSESRYFARYFEIAEDVARDRGLSALADRLASAHESAP